MVGVDEVVGGEGVRADGGTTGVQGFLWEVWRREREEREEEGKMKAAPPSPLPLSPHSEPDS